MTTATIITGAPEPREEPERKRTCFVISPIGDQLATAGSPALKAYEDSLEIYEKVILPACAGFGITPLRADGIAHAGEITEQIYRHLLLDDIVIADIGGGNANVMYELGIRHAAGKPAIQIGEHDNLPFDISSIRTIRFTRTRSGLIDARKALTAALDAGIREGFDLLPAARIQSGLLLSDAEAALRESAEAPPEDEDAPGILDDIAAVEAAMAELTRDSEEIAELLELIGQVTERSNEEMDGVNQAGDSMSVRMAVVARFADSIKGPAGSLEQVAIRFSERMGVVDAGVGGLLSIVEGTAPGERDDDVQPFLQQVIDLAQSVRGGMEGLASFGVAVDSIKSMSRVVRGPARSILSAVHHVASAASCVDDWERRARRLLE